VGADAITLYDTYLSLQARKPVNYGRIIRGIVESSISPDDGVITPDAFLIAQQYCYHYMSKYFLESFCKSEQFKRLRREQTDELENRRREEHKIRTASTVRVPISNLEIVSKMENLVAGSPRLSPKQPSRDVTTTTPRDVTTTTPRDVTTTTPQDLATAPQDAVTTPRDVATTPRDVKSYTPNTKSPGSSYRSSPTSSKTSSPQVHKRATKAEPAQEVDILDDSKFWEMPQCDYTLSAVDEWGVYQTPDKHLLNSPPQGSDKLKKSVMKLFGKEDITEEDAVAKARAIVEGVMNTTAKPLVWEELQ